MRMEFGRFVCVILYHTWVYDVLCGKPCEVSEGYLLSCLINHFQFAAIDVDYQAMNWYSREIGALADGVDDFTYIYVKIVKYAEPPQETLRIAQVLFLNQLLGVYA